MSAPTAPRGGLLLGIAMGLGNALSYLFVVVLTHAFGPDQFGAYTSLSTIGIVLAIPAGAFQVIIGRRWNDPAGRTSGLAAATGTGLVLTLATASAAPLLDDVLHLDALMPTFMMSLMLLPMTVTGAFQGLLLGSERLPRLAALYIVTAGTRLVAAFFCAALHASVAQVFGATAVASLLAACFGWWCCRDLLPRAAPHSRSLLLEMARSNSTLAAFTAMTNVDVVLVRHFLDGHTSGGYGLASTFARAMCWGTQFVALLIVPRMATSATRDQDVSPDGPRASSNPPPSGSDTLWRAAGLVVGIGALATGAVALMSNWLVTFIGGQGFSGYGGLVVACLGLGTLWALAQLWLFSEMAGDNAVLGTVTWAMVAVEAVVGWVWLHDSTGQVIALAATCAAVVVMVGAWRTRAHPVSQIEDESVLLVTDRT